MPQKILQDALSILLKMDLDDRDIDSLGCLQLIVGSSLLGTPDIAMDELGFSAEVRGIDGIGNTRLGTNDGDDAPLESRYQSGYSEIELDLIKSLSSELLSPVDRRFDKNHTDDNATSMELQARHAIILLSRSPAFPPLLQKKELSAAGVRANYNRLLPLLQIGGMAASDLEDTSDSANMWREAVRNPARRYSKPWARDPHNQSPAEVDNPPEVEDSDAYASLPTPVGVRMEEEPSASATFYKAARLPNVGELVEISFNDGNRYFPKIVGMTKQNNMVQLEPLDEYMRSHNYATLSNGGARTGEIWLSVRELFWNPNGYWKHSSAASAGAQRLKLVNQMRASKLHRSSSGLSRSGLSLSSVLSNAALPPAVLGSLEAEEENKGVNMATDEKRPNMVGGLQLKRRDHFYYVQSLCMPKFSVGAEWRWGIVDEHEFMLNSGPLRADAAMPHSVCHLHLLF